MAASKAQEAVERLWEVTRHLSQGANAGPGGIFSIEQDGDRLFVTIQEDEAVGRRYTLKVTSHRKVDTDSVLVAPRDLESGGVEGSLREEASE